MIKAIIFDLNGVFIISPKLSERFKNELGVPMLEFLVALKEAMTTLRLPNAPDAYVVWKPYLDKWKLEFSKEQFLDFWFRAEGGNTEMIELARKLKLKGIKLFILSNNFRERAEYYQKIFPFFTELFDKTYYSWQTGFIKPDKRAYELVLRENNLEPEEVAYFDDSEENVEVAKSLGIESYLFKDAKDVAKRVL